MALGLQVPLKWGMEDDDGGGYYDNLVNRLRPPKDEILSTLSGDAAMALRLAQEWGTEDINTGVYSPSSSRSRQSVSTFPKESQEGGINFSMQKLNLDEDSLRAEISISNPKTELMKYQGLFNRSTVDCPICQQQASQNSKTSVSTN